ncbi:MAG TPA: bifunctional [glutamate--ammonia ligase]-adenylyl-L-tyrosine phosphorylase/[glutamate--ammonia-ligase] adenylyltransferase [Rhodocyclaceae bacterium]|nr:bifunctional [glutamate--ammonia ligase]-adenylyl-L-tyrosine phosphorylase/[glutamate--ammonia-ligase] adenylyltransferase [Rhodocyclaceae bacterium]HMV52560.1 bifunctional [glutamate--ammonia ligase]-adenylyl-L-tyrosine phosphorylase/[glutamate--ammonia-ligase] adenylyltransferase [Rhodocyclaceae bacterium]HNA03433.1 bifunctional [glutamate--ammonia ligase]-adenylyl-L-tyrosine phosphorylase/[glutamate--ammonia-ligase] adenylyltransferase [Rhodocyclaceae bacterium]HNB79133.1 bifunctional [glu
MTLEDRNTAQLEHALNLSRFLRRALDARADLRPQLLASVHLPFQRAAMLEYLAASPLDENTLRPRLRALRARTLTHLIVRDLAGQAPLAEVTETMTQLADLAVAEALRVLRGPLVARHGEPRDAEGHVLPFIVIGMGKLGGRELNVSSDIDLIFVYPDDGETDGPSGIGNFEFFTKLGRQLIGALAEVTGDGQVFRVDMRLRPNGDSGPLVASFDMLENYFITQGREWERYAWIKARAMTGERDDDLAAIARPFVFRKYLDFGAVNAMRELHAQIREEVARRDMAQNIKLGPGGIREIEFIAQVFQLIRGGRDRALQIHPTLGVLARLAERGILDPEAVAELSAAYDFLRRLEHRLQYLDDAQTHTLPERTEDQALVAAAMGCADFAALLTELDRHRGRVSHHFDAVFADRNGSSHALDRLWSGSADTDTCAAGLERLGYTDPPAAAQRLADLRAGGRYQQMPAQVRARFDPLVPRLIEACAATPNPDVTLTRSLVLLDAISRRAAYLALLQQYPHALRKVADLMSASSWAADYLTRHPLLLDDLLDPRTLETAPDWTAFHAQLAANLDAVEPDVERQMDLMREAHHSQVFRLLTQDLAGLLTVERLADHLSKLADIMIELTIVTVWRKLRQRHRESPRFAVISYGKLGGKELGYASDLDIVFLYEDDDPNAQETYSRLAQRMNTWLSSATPAGTLFETDLRLRPNGDSGLLVSSLEAFRKYQVESAWVWEHQALTRARFSAGDPQIGAAFEAVRIEVLRQRRDLARLRDDVLAMRQKMVDTHGNKSELFDLKHDRGGLIDVEFIVQFLVLGHSHDHERLTGNLGNIALLGIAGEIGLIPADLAANVQVAYREYRRLQHGLRLNNANRARVAQESIAEHIDAVRALWRTVLGD